MPTPIESPCLWGVRSHKTWVSERTKNSGNLFHDEFKAIKLNRHTSRCLLEISISNKTSTFEKKLPELFTMSFNQRKKDAVSAFEAGDIEKSMNAHLLPAVPGAHDEPTLAQGRYAKPFVFGALDGLATIFALVAGSVGADLKASSLIAVGVGNLIAGALGMGIGALEMFS